ncbi:Uncharacterised protein [Streptococcus pyogenes]|uniref:hypothetical protein n=1 Tax=Streptococcus pyogenes TaxID=1314 RepID=UPI0010A11830|nr:hypothetical protein [Streptococcus pyogenes]VGW43456.1 Uncharacterised protein [Streptococcus pyogenes]VGW47647.1 Uncharacterised protein [Streptococcus pyogenes]VGX02320.1 Uncharacterised protein [Streptococcus pyogenes]VGX28043.1 Uncharacterised protein [Streptococcus pyogenes]VGX36333.1 Uncharacterised protein [Streptococcus pyogenes]
MSDPKNAVEISKCKILQKVWKKHIFPTWLLVTWIIISFIILLLRISSYYCNHIHVQWLQFSNFIFPGVTGLSFSVTMLNATRNLFDLKDLVSMFNFFDPTDNDISEKGDILYRTLAPYITASFLWLVISIVAFVSSLINIDFPIIINEILYALFNSLVVAGLLNLWYLVSVHLDDISIKVNTELEKEGD